MRVITLSLSSPVHVFHHGSRGVQQFSRRPLDGFCRASRAPRWNCWRMLGFCVDRIVVPVKLLAAALFEEQRVRLARNSDLILQLRTGRANLESRLPVAPAIKTRQRTWARAYHVEWRESIVDDCKCDIHAMFVIHDVELASLSIVQSRLHRLKALLLNHA